jgi:hypothetical protein
MSAVPSARDRDPDTPREPRRHPPAPRPQALVPADRGRHTSGEPSPPETTVGAGVEVSLPEPEAADPSPGGPPAVLAALAEGFAARLRRLAAIATDEARVSALPPEGTALAVSDPTGSGAIGFRATRRDMLSMKGAEAAEVVSQLNTLAREMEREVGGLMSRLNADPAAEARAEVAAIEAVRSLVAPERVPLTTEQMAHRLRPLAPLPEPPPRRRWFSSCG